MFKLDFSPTFWAPVRFEAQAATGNTRVVHEFQGQFPRMTEDELAAFSTQVLADRWTDRQVAEHLLRDWSDIADRHGNAMPYSEATRAEVFNTAGVPAAVVAGFRAAQPRAALGN